jgi:hypothetical protein
MSVRSGLAICGVIAALAVAGCGSSGSSSGGAAQPSWAAALGKGVTVIPPGATSPGNDTPADVVAGLVATMKAQNYPGICQYFPPSQQSSCQSSMSGVTAGSTIGKAFASFATIKPTYTVIDGDQALVGATGTVCAPSDQCSTNTDPAAVLDSGKPFTQLWIEANANSNAYAPIPLVKVNGKWYGYTATSS